MSQLTGKAVVTIHQLSVDDNTRAYTCAERQHDEVLHATGHTVNHLTHSSGIGVVGQSHGQIVETLAEHLSQGHHTVVSPCQVGSELYRTIIIVAVGGADAHGLDLVQTTHLFDDGLQGSHAGVNIVVHLVVALCLDGCSGLDFSTAVNNTENRVCTSEVQTDYIGFDHLCIHIF